MENLSPVPSGNPITRQLSLDLNGIMNVTAREKNTGLEKSIRIDNALTHFREGELQTAQDRISALFADSQAGLRLKRKRLSERWLLRVRMAVYGRVD